MLNKIVFKELYLNNWAQFKDTKILFAKNGKNVSYFIGKNGTGKTTLLNALYYIIFKTKKTPYAIKDILNKKAIIEGETPLKIELNLIFYKEDEYNQRVTYNISRIWVFDENSTIDDIKIKNPEEFIGRKIIGDTRKSLSEEEFHKEMLNLIPSAVRDYYFLDGEQLRGLFDQSKLKSIKNLSLNLSDILKVEALIKLLEKFGKYLNNEAKKGGKMGSNTNVLMDRINEILEIEEKLKKEIEEKQEVIEEAENNSEEIFSRIRKFLEKENRINEYNKLIKKKENVVKQIGKISNELNEILRNGLPVLFLDQLGILDWIQKDLEKKNKTGEIPAPIDASLILHILQTNQCICKRELDKESSDYFEDLCKNLPTKSLNQAVRTFTNKLSREINNVSKYKTQIYEIQAHLNILNKERYEVDDTIDDIMNEIGKPGDIAISEIDLYKKLQDQIADLKKEIGKQETNIKTLESQKLKLQIRLKGQLTRLKTIGAKSKEFLYLKNLDVLSLLNILHQGLIDKIRIHIQESTNEVFLKIIWDSYNWSGIEIDKNWKVITKDREGTPYQHMSAGQNHVLGISFMSSLTAITKLKIPFVFDSPFGRISEDPIEKIGKFLPSLMIGSQIILFVTDTEDSNIYKHIKNSIGRKYRIVKISASLSKIEYEEIN